MDKKEKLLQTALTLFVSQGFTDTPTSKIAKEAGVATGTLFYFFPTKDELIVSLYSKLKKQAAEGIQAALAKVNSRKGAIKAYYEESLKWSLRNPNEFSFLAQFSNSPYLKKVGADEVSVQVAPVLQLFREAIAGQQIVDMDVTLLYALISNQVFGVNQYLSSNSFSKREQQDIIEDTFLMFWRMIEGR
ncbi:TetR family transcriptional regulator [Pedobacter yulinensis]|uniref:TetR family transcriptional regulator n=1 Tax=Pedobacter yulinensis TaxID=2126353 RepID=A0A2T3HLB4_9SPHI|nr:TetR/AcrR family transcriptional regulator [Pedobacter yulinensis]PST83181.1 TetR family transcriptional regulator [Pedobacter yulinensis]